MQQSPIDLPVHEEIKYDPNFQVSLHYNTVKGVALEDIEWSVRVSRNLINVPICFKKINL